MTGDGPPADEAATLQVLLADYSNLRDDERQNLVVTVTMASVAMAFLTAIVAFLPRPCTDAIRTGCLRPWVYAFVPLAPFAVIGHVTVLGATATLRSYYLRALERLLEQYGPTLDNEALDAPVGTLRTPSFMRLNVLLVSPRRGLVAFRTIQTGLMVVIGSLFAAVTTSALSGVQPDELRAGAMLIYAVGSVLLLRAVRAASIGGRALWYEVLERSGSVLAPLAALTPATPPRGLLSYFVVPRPADLIAKLPIVPAAIVLIGILVDGPSRFEPLPTLLFVLVFEVGAYQTRYVWNDIRNLIEDSDHPERNRRFRLGPPATRKRLLQGMGVLGARLLILIASLPFVAREFSRTSVGFLVAIFVVAVLYETARDRSASVLHRPRMLTRWKTAVYLAVGLGYGLRVLVGAWLAGEDRAAWLAGAGLTGYFLGIMFVTMAWALEGASILAAVKNPPGATLVEADAIDRVLRFKRHLGPLVLQLQRSGFERPRGRDEAAPVAHTRLLRWSLDVRTIWNVALIAAAGAAGATGVGLNLPDGSATAAIVIAAMAVGAVAASGVVWLHRRTVPSALVAAAGGVILSLLPEAAPLPPPFTAAPFLAVITVYFVFLNMTSDDTYGWERTLRLMIGGGRRLSKKLVEHVIGRTSAELLRLHGRERARTPPPPPPPDAGFRTEPKTTA